MLSSRAKNDRKFHTFGYLVNFVQFLSGTKVCRPRVRRFVLFFFFPLKFVATNHQQLLSAGGDRKLVQINNFFASAERPPSSA